MIDKLSLTTYRLPDKEYLQLHGITREDKFRSRLFKYICELDNAVVFFIPHKFSDITNAQITTTKIDMNPKNFMCYDYMFAYLCSIFGDSDIKPEEFNVSRIDIAVDIEDFPMDFILSIMRVQKIKTESLSFFKGTIYAGSDPKIRIYDKVKQLKSLQKKGVKLTDYEQSLIESGKSYTRFEIQIRSVKKTLMGIADNPEIFASYYDRLEFFNVQNNDNAGILHFLYKYINRKFRKQLEEYKNYDIVAGIKERYVSSVKEWFSYKEPF